METGPLLSLAHRSSRWNIKMGMKLFLVLLPVMVRYSKIRGTEECSGSSEEINGRGGEKFGKNYRSWRETAFGLCEN